MNAHTYSMIDIKIAHLGYERSESSGLSDIEI